jgi:hypothetical protein
MSRLAFAAAAVVALSTAACATAPVSHDAAVRIPSAPAHAKAARVEAPPVAAWAWVREMDRTRTLALDSEGNVVGTIDGIAIMTKKGLVRVTETKVPVATQPCERFDDKGNELPRDQWDPPQAGEATRMSLATAEGSVPFVSPEAGDGANELQHSAEIVASVGPYLFVRESMYAYACGAHGFTSVSAMVYDVEQRAEVPMAPAKSDEAALRKRAALALTSDDGFDPDGEAGVELTEAQPEWKGASLSLKFQFTAGTCYACGDGAWSSYTKSVALDAPALPRELAPYANPPEAVRKYLAKNAKSANLKLGGFSVPSA